MADASSLRVFFALRPEPAQCREIHRLMHDCPGKVGALVHPQDLHLTLAFLGRCSKDRVAELSSVARQICWSPFSLTLDRLVWWEQSSVFCLVASHPVAELAELARELARACDLQKDDALPFVPHVTLVRRAKAIKDCHWEQPQIMQFSQFELIESVPSSAPPRYRTLDVFAAET